MENFKNERELETACCSYAREKGIAAIKLDPTDNKGIPDRLFITPYGFIFFVEFKNPDGKGRTSKEQRFWRKFIGANHYIVDDYAAFIQLVNTLNQIGV